MIVLQKLFGPYRPRHGKNDTLTQKLTPLKIIFLEITLPAIYDQSAAEIQGNILRCTKDKGVDLSKCMGQGFESAATMSDVPPFNQVFWKKCQQLCTFSVLYII